MNVGTLVCPFLLGVTDDTKDTTNHGYRGGGGGRWYRLSFDGVGNVTFAHGDTTAIDFP